jgi:predicted small secreted protein
MKILRLLTVLVIAALTFAACDDTTEGIGGSITNDIDNINITSAVFPVATKSMVSGAVLSRNNSGLIGKMKDPETGNYVKGDYMKYCASDVDVVNIVSDATTDSLGGVITCSESKRCYY